MPELTSRTKIYLLLFEFSIIMTLATGAEGGKPELAELMTTFLTRLYSNQNPKCLRSTHFTHRIPVYLKQKHKEYIYVKIETLCKNQIQSLVLLFEFVKLCYS